MRAVSIFLLIAGVIFTIACVIYFRSVVNVADSDSMTINRSGSQVSEWPVFIGIIMTFVGAVFFYISMSEKKIK